MESKLELFVLILVIIIMLAGCGPDKSQGGTELVPPSHVHTYSTPPGVQATYEARPAQMRALEAIRKNQ